MARSLRQDSWKNRGTEVKSWLLAGSLAFISLGLFFYPIMQAYNIHIGARDMRFWSTALMSTHSVMFLAFYGAVTWCAVYLIRSLMIRRVRHGLKNKGKVSHDRI